MIPFLPIIKNHDGHPCNKRQADREELTNVFDRSLTWHGSLQREGPGHTGSLLILCLGLMKKDLVCRIQLDKEGMS